MTYIWILLHLYSSRRAAYVILYYRESFPKLIRVFLGAGDLFGSLKRREGGGLWLNPEASGTLAAFHGETPLSLSPLLPLRTLYIAN